MIYIVMNIIFFELYIIPAKKRKTNDNDIIISLFGLNYFIILKSARMASAIFKIMFKRYWRF